MTNSHFPEGLTSQQHMLQTYSQSAPWRAAGWRPAINGNVLPRSSAQDSSLSAHSAARTLSRAHRHGASLGRAHAPTPGEAPHPRPVCRAARPRGSTVQPRAEVTGSRVPGPQPCGQQVGGGGRRQWKADSSCLRGKEGMRRTKAHRTLLQTRQRPTEACPRVLLGLLEGN